MTATADEFAALDPTALGHTVGLAQRMESLAVPGSVYLTGATAELVGGYFDLRDLGAMEVKGVHGYVRVFELVSRTFEAQCGQFEAEDFVSLLEHAPRGGGGLIQGFTHADVL